MVFVYLVSLPVTSFAALPQEMTIVDKTALVEKIYYGAEQTGSLLERIAKLEKDIYGVEAKDALMNRVDKIYTYTKETSAAVPAFLLKLNALEWAINHNVTNQPTKLRLEGVERILLGNVGTNSFNERMNKMLKLAYVNGQLDVLSTSVAKDTLVKIKIDSPLSTKTSRVGDVVNFQAADDIFVGGILVIAKGSQGFGKVQKIESAQNFGRDAKLEISFDTIELLDSSTLPVFMGEKAKEETKSLAKTAGATLAGLAILGPVGILGGAFVRGQDITIPAGSEVYVQAQEDIETFGIATK